MALLKHAEAQAMSLLQNELAPLFKSVDVSIKTEAQNGNFSVQVTLTGGDIATGPKLVEDLQLRGFTAALSGVSSEILTISWNV